MAVMHRGGVSTETLKRHDTNIFYLVKRHISRLIDLILVVITTFKSINRHIV